MRNMGTFIRKYIIGEVLLDFMGFFEIVLLLAFIYKVFSFFWNFKWTLPTFTLISPEVASSSLSFSLLIVYSY